jgi:hypothetical protein
MDLTARTLANIIHMPTEIILQIFGWCHGISDLINLASTCQRLRHIWIENIILCVSTATDLTASEIDDVISFARQEHDIKHAQAATVLPVPSDHSEQIYRWLPSIMATADHCDLLKTCYFKSLAEFNSKGYAHQKHISHQYPGEHPSSICKSYLAIRRLVLGYDHFDFLRLAYAEIHRSSDKDLDDIEVVSILLKSKITVNQSETLGMTVNEPQWQWWDYNYTQEEYYHPLEWEFAFYIIWLAARWRFDHPEDAPSSDYEQEAAKVYEAWDHDRVSAMWGSIERPWEKLSARWQSRSCDGRKEWYKDGRHIPRRRERDFHSY